MGFDRLSLLLLIGLALTRVVPGASVLTDAAALLCAIRLTTKLASARFARAYPPGPVSRTAREPLPTSGHLEPGYEIVGRALKNEAPLWNTSPLESHK
jgi:hypothetical protein